MSYGADEDEQWRRTAIIADKIFKGAKPADIPMEQPTKFKLVIDLKTARGSASHSRRPCWCGRTS